jgi:hypothetical protein
MEVLMAGAVLIVGMTGLTQLVVYGMNSYRTSVVQTGAELESQAAVADVLMTSYGGLTTGTFDGGMTIDVDGRKYARVITVTSVGDGGGVGAFRVEVRTTWTDGAGLSRQAVAVGLVTETPDGG